MKRIMKSCGVLASCLITAGLLAIGVTSASANDIQTVGRSVEEFVNPDGSFDLEALRRSDYSGYLNLEGLDVQLDPVTGEPIVRSLVAGTAEDHPDDMYWDNSISPSIAGVSDEAYTATVYNGKLIVGGYFQVVGDAMVYHIASWDGSDWYAMGSGMDRRVEALTVYDGELIAGGIFDEAGGVSADHIASWDGSSWSSLQIGADGAIYALAVYDGTLIAGGGEFLDSRWRVGHQIGLVERPRLVSPGFGCESLGTLSDAV